MVNITYCDYHGCEKVVKEDASWTLFEPAPTKNNELHPNTYDLCPEHGKVLLYLIRNPQEKKK